ncbi:MAG: S8 family serine peptidase [Nitrospira sp.]|nr:S8 family serine peptidase [Nitrospira sp.]
MNLWFEFTLQQGTDAVAFLKELRDLPSVEIAEPAPLPQPLSAITPDFSGNQGYLDVAPGGIEARFSFGIPGGNGNGVTIYDIEYSWHQTHEDLSKAHGLPLLVNPGDLLFDPFHDDNHGTAVLGEMIADKDAKGMTGISWGANIGLAPAQTINKGYNPANAILLAVADGSPGDIILLEQQAAVCGLGEFDWGPVEWISDVFDAIQTAVAEGYVVIEAAGNGNVNLDQPSCGDFFNRTVQDSGAIIVGAGNHPSSGADRQRTVFSSYGSRIDLQGWGFGVSTTGYGLSHKNSDASNNPDFWYTQTFSGTSSASPIVAGAATNLQGIAFSRLRVPLTPLQLRTLLVQTGSPQLGNTSENIGPRPNLKEAIAELMRTFPNLFTLTINKAGSGSGTVRSNPVAINCGTTCSTQFNEGTSVTLTAVATDGSTFAGWTGGGCSGTGVCSVNAEATVTATFTKPFTLTINKAGSGSGTVRSNPVAINCGATCSTQFNEGTSVTLTAVATDGSTFAGWTGGGCSSMGICSVNADATVTATFSNTVTTSPVPAPSNPGGGGCTLNSSSTDVVLPALLMLSLAFWVRRLRPQTKK